MPYQKIEELPKSVRDHLPKHAQAIYKEAYNHAWDEYADPKDRRDGESREAVASQVAWAAVKKSYEKDESTGNWHKK
jgi:cation transport regulator